MRVCVCLGLAPQMGPATQHNVNMNPALQHLLMSSESVTSAQQRTMFKPGKAQVEFSDPSHVSGFVLVPTFNFFLIVFRFQFCLLPIRIVLLHLFVFFSWLPRSTGINNSLTSISGIRNSFPQFLPPNGGDGDLSTSPTTSNQLAHWFTPELLAQAQVQTRTGKSDSTLNMVSVEELERLQQNSAPVIN